MMQRLRTLNLQRAVALMMILIIGGMLVFGPDMAFAADGGGGGGKKNCEGEGLIARIVPCVTDTIEKVTEKLAKEIADFFAPAVGAFVTLAIVIYGVRIMTPEGNVQKTAMPFLLKIAFILFFTVGYHAFGGFIPAVHGGMHEIVDILANTLDVSDKCGGGGGGGGGAGGHASDKIWKAMDCILGKLFGFTTGKDNNAMLIASIFGLMAGFFFGGSFGMIAFFGVIGVLWSVFMFVYRAVFAFLNGFMLASFMILISPMFIPLLLLQVTGTYFQSWLRVFIGAFILPVVIVGYSCFALSIYQKILFDDDSAMSIRKVTDKDWSESITGMRQECSGTLLNNILYRSFEGDGSGGDLDSRITSYNVPNMSVAQQSGAQGICVKVPNIDMHELSEGFKNKQDFFRRIFVDSMALLILAWVLSATVPVLVEMVAAMGAGVSAALMGPLTSMEKKMQAAWDNAKARAEQAFADGKGGSVSGPEFIRQVPTAIKDFGSQILGINN